MPPEILAITDGRALLLSRPEHEEDDDDRGQQTATTSTPGTPSTTQSTPCYTSNRILFLACIDVPIASTQGFLDQPTPRVYDQPTHAHRESS